MNEQIFRYLFAAMFLLFFIIGQAVNAGRAARRGGRFGDAYRAYAQRTGRFLPRLRG